MGDNLSRTSCGAASFRKSRTCCTRVHPHPLRLDLQGIAVVGLLPVVNRMLGVVPPAAQVAADEADPHVARTPTHLGAHKQFLKAYWLY